MVWSLALCPDDAKQNPVVYGAASIQEGHDYLGLYHSGLEGERYFRLVVKLT